MYRNILLLGAAGQLALYAPAGDAVIGVCIQCRKDGLTDQQIVAAMEAKIVEVGPTSVSLHCADPQQVNVIDIAPSSIVDPVAFLEAIEDAKAHGFISRFFSPAQHDRAFHIEIPQE